MGDSKRRKEQLGDGYGKTEPVFSWLPGLTKEKASQFVSITTFGAWAGISAMIALWVVVRFVGPAAGWWELSD
jgi:Protein of unknown function (DUF2839)